GFWLTLPIANVTLLFKELMLGIFDINHILVVLFCVLFLASISVFLAIKLFGREEVLFGEASSFSLAWKRQNIIAKPNPGPSEALFFTMLSMGFLLYLAIPLQANDLVTGLIVTEVLIFLSLPIAFAAYLKFDLKTTFRLRTPSAGSLAATLLLFAGTFFSIGTIVYVQNQLFPIPKEFEDYIQKAMKTLYDRSFVSGFLLIAILPAVCEETTFRGVILSGMLSRFKPYTALFLNAFFFGVFHLSLHRFPGVFLIGFAAAYVVWKSGSIFTGMLLHMLCNGYMTLLFKFPHLDWLGLLEGRPSVALTTIGVVLVGLAAVVMNRASGTFRTRSSPTEPR
ncbi:MAG TPA: type II CAAX endopeptidase family protein, partial [Acidobacteriota bacterium]|nr:type II CAAX endopeptidase family protein [Acidobacteriota bacterium]